MLRRVRTQFILLAALALSAPMGIAMAANSLSVNIHVTLSAPTNTTLTSDVNPSQQGQAVNFKAVVKSPLGVAMPTPTGTVTFTIDGVAQTPVTLDASGNAAFSSNTLPVGDHQVQAKYNGDGEGNASTSSVLVQSVKGTPPVVVSVLTPGAPTGVTDTPVQFTFAAGGAAPIHYAWDFGDGATLNTTATTVDHTYTVIGTYTVSVTATDANGQSISSSIPFQVIAAATAPGGGGICDGLNPIDLHVQQVAAKLFFPSLLRKDSLAFKGIVQLKDGFNPAGQVVQWDIAGIPGNVTLDAKGASPKSTTVKVSLKFKKPAKGAAFTARPGTLQISMKAQSLTTLLLTGIANLNANNINKKGDTGTVMVCVVLQNSQAYQASGVSGLYKAKKDKTGAFSAKFK